MRKPAPKAKASVIQVEDSPKSGAPEDAGTTTGSGGAPQDAEKNDEEQMDARPELRCVPSVDVDNVALPEGEAQSGTKPEVEVQEEHEEEEEAGGLPAGAGEAFVEAEAAALPAGSSAEAPELEVLEEETAEESDEDKDDEWDRGPFGNDYENAQKILLEDSSDGE